MPNPFTGRGPRLSIGLFHIGAALLGLLAVVLVVRCSGTAEASHAGAPSYFDRLEARPGAAMRRLVVGACGQAGEALLEDRQGAFFRIRVAQRRVRLEPVRVCDPPEQARPPGMLPDGEVSRGAGPIAEAWLAHPTGRYDHGILGDALEAGELRVRLAAGPQLTYRLDVDTVFEDRRARIVDLDRDGKPELLVVRSGLDSGGSLALLAVQDGELRLVATSPSFGQRNRWLNPVGVADFDGDGKDEIAAVLTPHIGGVLTLFERDGERLMPDGQMGGFSNHAIGSRELDMSAVLDANRDGVPDLVVPDAARRSLRIVTFAGGTFRELQVVPNAERIVSGIHLLDVDGDGQGDLVYALEDGSIIVLLRH